MALCAHLIQCKADPRARDIGMTTHTHQTQVTIQQKMYCIIELIMLIFTYTSNWNIRRRLVGTQSTFVGLNSWHNYSYC